MLAVLPLDYARPARSWRTPIWWAGTAVLIVLLVTAVASYRWSPGIWWTTGRGSGIVAIEDGAVCIYSTRSAGAADWGTGIKPAREVSPAGLLPHRVGWTGTGTMTSVPLWIPAVVLAIVLVWTAWRRASSRTTATLASDGGPT